MLYLMGACSFWSEPQITIEVTDIWGTPVVAVVSVINQEKQTNESGKLEIAEKQLYSEEITIQEFTVKAPEYMRAKVSHTHLLADASTARITIQLYPELKREGVYLVGEQAYVPISETLSREISSDLDVFVGFETNHETHVQEGDELLLYLPQHESFEVHQLRSLEKQSIKIDNTIQEHDFQLHVLGSLVQPPRLPLAQKNVFRIHISKELNDGDYALHQKTTHLQDAQPAFIFQKGRHP